MEWQCEIHGGKDQRGVTQLLSCFNYSATKWVLSVPIVLNCFYLYNLYPHLDHWLQTGTINNTDVEIQKVTEKL